MNKLPKKITQLVLYQPNANPFLFLKTLTRNYGGDCDDLIKGEDNCSPNPDRPKRDPNDNACHPFHGQGTEKSSVCAKRRKEKCLRECGPPSRCQKSQEPKCEPARDVPGRLIKDKPVKGHATPLKAEEKPKEPPKEENKCPELPPQPPEAPKVELKPPPPDPKADEKCYEIKEAEKCPPTLKQGECPKVKCPRQEKPPPPPPPPPCALPKCGKKPK